MKNIFKINIFTYIFLLLAFLAGYFKETMLILFIVIFHEMGHVFFFFLFKIKVCKVEIYPFGGVTLIEKKIHERIYKDIICSLGGVLFQLLLYPFFYLLRNDINLYNHFLEYNKIILIFNLLPMIPLDGSKVVLAILTKFIAFKISYILMIIISILTMVMFFSYSFLSGVGDITLSVFLIGELIMVIRNYKYIKQKFYLERIIYDNYYDRIKYHGNKDLMHLTVYYYFNYEGKVIGEKEYLKMIENKVF